MFDTKFSSVYRGFDSEAIPVNRKNYIKTNSSVLYIPNV